VSFPGLPASAAAVRRLVERELRGRIEPAVLADAVLIASELASNAILHASSPFSFALLWERGLLAMEVTDEVPGELPPVQPAPPQQASGRGLWLVDQLTSRWGCTPLADGKRVWCELPAPARPPA
jgi:anti-sigma regulatory factor (Ser/Thr protein kinase)